MERLSALNVIGVASIALLAAVSAGLALQGLATGSAHIMHPPVSRSQLTMICCCCCCRCCLWPQVHGASFSSQRCRRCSHRPASCSISSPRLTRPRHRLITQDTCCCIPLTAHHDLLLLLLLLLLLFVATGPWSACQLSMLWALQPLAS
jgi:hypothetical protein